MFTRKLLLALALIAPGIAFCQVPRQKAHNRASTAATDACQSTFTFGSGQTLFNFCVSSNGNLVQFTSPDGFEHIREGDAGEGYGICDLNQNTSYFDYSDAGTSGNWNDSVITQPGGPNTFPLKITRTTSDGVFTLKQTFSRNTAERIAKITMTLTNNKPGSRYVYFLRFADIDANNAHHGDFQNEFDFGAQAAWGYNSGEYGVTLSEVSNVEDYLPLIWSIGDGPDPCAPLANVPLTPFVGDGSVGIVFGFNLPSGKSKTIGTEYQRF